MREDGSAFDFLNMLQLKSSVRRSPCSIAAPIHVYTMDTEVYRVMNRAMRDAMRGRSVDAIETEVSHARGVDAHVTEHATRRES